MTLALNVEEGGEQCGAINCGMLSLRFSGHDVEPEVLELWMCGLLSIGTTQPCERLQPSSLLG